MRILGIDYGSKRIGLALSDETAYLASTLTVIKRTSPQKDLEKIAAICSEREVGTVVVGMPYSFSGGISIQTQHVIDFIKRLREFLEIPVDEYDERFTSVMSERVLLEAGLSRKKRKGIKDKLSASFILQSYLDFKSREQR